jgi:hypothetical protein
MAHAPAKMSLEIVEPEIVSWPAVQRDVLAILADSGVGITLALIRTYAW